MADEAEPDLIAAHRHFSTHCFNLAWELMEKKDRSADDDEQLIRLVHASLWHWSQRTDCSNRNLSIGYWQASRAYVLIGQTESARRYAKLSLKSTPPDDEFCLGYACEAMARAELLANNRPTAEEFLTLARRHCDNVADAESRQSLLSDLESLGHSHQ